MWRVALLYLVCGSSLALAQQRLYIEVREGRVRVEPKHWAATVATLRYGDAMELVADGSDWLQVRTDSGQQGFIHASSVTDRKVVLKAKELDQNLINSDPSEVVVAGKGFSADLERLLASQQPQMNYAAVDSMQSERVSEGELINFMRQGELG